MTLFELVNKINVFSEIKLFLFDLETRERVEITGYLLKNHDYFRNYEVESIIVDEVCMDVLVIERRLS